MVWCQTCPDTAAACRRQAVCACLYLRFSCLLICMHGVNTYATVAQCTAVLALCAVLLDSWTSCLVRRRCCTGAGSLLVLISFCPGVCYQRICNNVFAVTVPPTIDRPLPVAAVGAGACAVVGAGPSAVFATVGGSSTTM
ncbi:hypothetical protein COO60DRAFT_1550654 [Scenedesmus sp. NREL 46B-D3]|nr:hypothetical protein COO60DRAFT_1550654 [Scenedesmus sp. NREL 46B-D3]